MASVDTNFNRSADHAPAIELIGVVKRYGDMVAVKDLSFRVERGDLFGFIGANGAGKTSTMRMLATFLTPDAGTARILGHDVVSAAQQVRRLIGYMPDHFGLYREMKVGEFLDFFAAAYQLPSGQRTQVIGEVLDQVRLTDKRESVIGTLSHGMQQRLALARALVHDPPVLLLDEPASGLDPRARADMMSLLKALQRAGKTIFISSHILGELEELCNRLTIMDRGRRAFCGTLAELRREIQKSRQLYVEVADRPEEARRLLASRPEVASVEPQGTGLEVGLKAGENDFAFVAACLVTSGFRLVALRERAAALEELFLQLTGDGSGSSHPKTEKER